MTTPAPVKLKNNTMAMVSFFTGLGTFLLVCLSSAVNFMSFLSAIGSLVAIVTGFISLSQISRSNGTEAGRGFAIAGLVLGILFFIISCLVIVFVVVLGRAILDSFYQALQGIQY